MRTHAKIEEEIEAARTPNGGWTKEQLAKWGVSWPPPKGWKRKLIEQQGSASLNSNAISPDAPDEAN
jgi:hypothetical protein